MSNPMSDTPLTDALDSDLYRKQVSGMMKYPAMLAQARSLERALNKERELHDAARRHVEESGIADARWIYILIGMIGGMIGGSAATALAFATWGALCP